MVKRNQNYPYFNDYEVAEIYPEPEKLEFVLSPSVNTAIKNAGNAVDQIAENLDVISWSFFDFGKNALKELKVSPDSFIQIAIQYAFFRLHNRPGAQYESGSLRKYVSGRTDTIRTCTEQVVNFCQIMSNSSVSASSKKAALLVALNSHKVYVQNVINGCGIDRHLLALKILAKNNNINDIKLFDHVAYQRSTHFELSTSNVPTNSNGFMVYGPLVEDGYACCYNPRDNNILFGTSAWCTSNVTRLAHFKFWLRSCLREMKLCLEYIPEKSKL